jgi:single-strand DNA-binding protein
MASFNRVILVGNLTRDVELRYTPAQTAVCDIGLAVNERVKRNDQWTDECTFVDITLFGRTAEVAGEYLKKGSPVLIEGRLKLDAWTDNTGQKRSKLKVVGEKLQMLGGGKRDSQERDEGPNDYNQDPPQTAATQPAVGDDIPF